MRRLAPLFSLCLALGCGSSTGVVDPFEYGEPFWLEVGQAAISSDGTTSVRFERVVSDSRCPADVVCVWAGEAFVALSVSRLDVPVPAVLTPFLEVKVGALEPQQIHGRMVFAEELLPRNRTDRPMGDKRVQLRIDAVMPFD